MSFLIELEAGLGPFIATATSFSPSPYNANETKVGYTGIQTPGYTTIGLSYAQLRQALQDAQAEGLHVLDLTASGVKTLNERYAHLRAQPAEGARPRRHFPG